jgi:hypothetical protein
MIALTDFCDKTCYRNRKLARKYAKILGKKHGIKTYTYYCPACDAYHITKMSRTNYTDYLTQKQNNMKVIITPDQFGKMTASEIVQLMEKHKSYAIHRNEETGESLIYDRNAAKKKEAKS